MRLLLPCLTVAVIAAVAVPALAQVPPPPAQGAQPGPIPTDGPYKTLKDQASYLMGMQIGYNLQRQGFEVDSQVFLQGMLDAFAKADPKVDPTQAEIIVTGFLQKLEADHVAKCAAEAPGNREAGQKFLTENKLREGVTTTPSGLQYKIIQEGTGATPKETDVITFHYKGHLIDGSVFDESYKGGTPATIPLAQLIPGWIEAMKMMKEGSKWQLFLPADLAYGDKPRRGSGVPAGATLVFDVELIKIEPPQQGFPGGLNLQGGGGGGGN